jgi:hypothetical protein
MVLAVDFTSVTRPKGVLVVFSETMRPAAEFLCRAAAGSRRKQRKRTPHCAARPRLTRVSSSQKTVWVGLYRFIYLPASRWDRVIQPVVGPGFWAILKPSSVLHGSPLSWTLPCGSDANSDVKSAAVAKRFALLETNAATNKIDGDANKERTSPLV